MLEAAMGAVIEDVEAARNLPFPSPDDRPNTPEAYSVRQRVNRAGFSELRNGFLRFGGTLTVQFLQLDKEIDDFTGQCTPVPPRLRADGVVVAMPSLGLNAGLEEQLDRIEQQAIALRDKAVGGMKLCREELANELINLEP